MTLSKIQRNEIRRITASVLLEEDEVSASTIQRILLQSLVICGGDPEAAKQAVLESVDEINAGAKWKPTSRQIPFFQKKVEQIIKMAQEQADSAEQITELLAHESAKLGLEEATIVELVQNGLENIRRQNPRRHAFHQKYQREQRARQSASGKLDKSQLVSEATLLLRDGISQYGPDPEKITLEIGPRVFALCDGDAELAHEVLSKAMNNLRHR